MSDTIPMDGRAGEGGGQILRTSLALSALTGRTLVMDHIRAKRSKPGLLRQHLTAVRAAQTIADARVSGAELGSGSLRFEPGAIRGGEHTFAVGTAGSAVLVFQTVLPMLLRAPEPSVVRFEGGTHNQSAPTYDFLEKVFAPMLRRMGARLEVSLERYGFYPAGGGAFTVRVEPGELRPLEGAMALEPAEPVAESMICRIPFEVARRELAVLERELGLPEARLRPRQVRSAGPGNVLSLFYDASVPELLSAFGRRGRRSEAVAEDLVAQARQYLAYGAPVGEHLADQLILPLALGGGRFRTGFLSSHTSTNIETVRAFLGESALRARPDEAGVVIEATGATEATTT